jgi:serine/threonine protein kinase
VTVLEPGQVVADRYLLSSLIGEGAMGAVFQAEDQTLKRQVAIKFLFVRGTRDPQVMVDQFLREARIAASVQHRNVIQTVDFGTYDQYQPFMVMELLSGESLGDRMAREPGLTREQLVHILSLTLRGLAAVHDAGIVHRDLKPQNIFLQRDADAVYPKILDFGISRSVDPGGARASAIATQEGMIVGTPDYMSPEQARGESNIDKRSDIYSMGVILYEGMTGRPPFEAANIGELIVKIMTAEPPAIRELCPDIPQALSDLVTQAMSKDREQRFADARALRRALLAAAESALPSSRRAMSLPPGAPNSTQVSRPPPVPGRLPPAAPAQTGAATWGDFEGLNARQILDTGGPAPASVPEPPQQQRIVANAAEPLGLDLAPAAATKRSSGERAPAAPRASGAGERTTGAGAPRRNKNGGGRAAAEAAEPALDVALDPLYAGSGQAAPDIDYDRVGAAGKKLQAPAQARSPAQAQRSRAARTRPRAADLPHARVRGRSSWGAWLLPAIALLLLGYFWYRPAGSSLPSAAAGDGADLQRGAASSDAAGSSAHLLNQGADADLRQMRLQTKSRRAQPGLAAPHMRDVVF